MSQTLQYKGYDGSVLYSAEDRLLYGTLIGIRDLISYESTDIEGLEGNFRAAIDDYLQFCVARNKTPDTPFKGTFNVRVGRDLHMRAARLAAARKTKLNTVVQEALEEYLSHAS